MKRLIKSKIFDGFNMYNETYFVFENPTDSEINEVRKLSLGIRGLIYNNGTIYIWPGEMWHDYIKSKVKNLDVDQFRFSYGDHWEFNLHGKYTFQEGYEIINKYKDFLSKIGDFNQSGSIGYTPDNDVIRFDKIEDIKNKIKEPAMAKLIKSEYYSAHGKIENNNYYECFKNPTTDEWNKLFKADLYDAVRSIIEKDGTVYAWIGDVLHRDAKNYFKIPDGVRLSIDDDKKVWLSLIPEVDIEYMKNALNNATSLFNTISKNAKIEYIYSDFGINVEPFKQFKIINDIINYKEPAIARLIKGELYTAKNCSYLDDFSNYTIDEINKAVYRNKDEYPCI